MLLFGVLSRFGRRHFSLSGLYLLRIAICHLDRLLHGAHSRGLMAESEM